MKLIKSIMSAFAIVLATTACAGNSGENKKSNEPTKKENKMEVIALNKADFLKKVYNYEANPNDWKFEGSRPAIVDFYATWCGPCKVMHPILEELSKEYSGKVDIYQIDVDKEQDLAAAFGIRSIPTLLMIPMKEEPRIMQGAMPKDQLKKAIDEFEDVKIVYPIHKNPLVRQVANEIFKDDDKIKLIEPLDVVDFHNMMNKAYMILTDSGGVQEEAPSLGKPVLVLRNTTERPEGVEAGTLKLVGTNEQNIYNAVKELLTNDDEYLKMSKASNPYGDGFTSDRIVTAILKKYNE